MTTLNFLFVMDPLARLDLKWDTSLTLARELIRRRHSVWLSDSVDLSEMKGKVEAHARKLSFTEKQLPLSKHGLRFRYKLSAKRRFSTDAFDLILIRKDPPFDRRYLYLTHLLQKAAKSRPVLNHPAGIRHNNEKLSILRFPKWAPETCISASLDEIFHFRHSIKQKTVIKPLDSKGGYGVFVLSEEPGKAKKQLLEATADETVYVMAQAFVPAPSPIEKRILLLNGDYLSCFEKRAKKGEFRANLGLGATFHASRLTAPEKNMIQDLKPYLRKHGLLFVGIDVLNGKLLEINVTSPAGLYEADLLYPKQHCAAKVAAFLESQARD